MKIVVKLGGSLSIGDTGPDFSYFSRLVPVISRIKAKNQLIIAVGGGRLTRSFGKSMEQFRLTDDEKEKIFIQLIGANVMFASSLLRMDPILSLEEIEPNTSGIIGGAVPGRSTDANAAIAAEKIRADVFIKMTDVDGIYTKDPKKFRGAKPIRSMKFDELKKFSAPGRPNSYGILDATAIKTLASARIKTVIINGKNPEDLLDVIAGRQLGTVIS